MFGVGSFYFELWANFSHLFGLVQNYKAQSAYWQLVSDFVPDLVLLQWHMIAI
jgi:hypothetical protein